MTEFEKYLSNCSVEFTDTPFLNHVPSLRESYVKAFITGGVKASSFIEEKAIEWLKNNMPSQEYIGVNDSITKSEFIKRFKDYLSEEL